MIKSCGKEKTLMKYEYAIYDLKHECFCKDESYLNYSGIQSVKLISCYKEDCLPRLFESIQSAKKLLITAYHCFSEDEAWAKVEGEKLSSKLKDFTKRYCVVVLEDCKISKNYMDIDWSKNPVWFIDDGEKG